MQYLKSILTINERERGCHERPGLPAVYWSRTWAAGIVHKGLECCRAIDSNSGRSPSKGDCAGSGNPLAGGNAGEVGHAEVANSRKLCGGSLGRLPQNKQHAKVRLLLGFSQAYPELPRCFSVTKQAKRTKVIEITFASALCHRKNMIRVPEALADAFAEIPVSHEREPFFSARVTQLPEFLHGIDAADCAHALVTDRKSVV